MSEKRIVVSVRVSEEVYKNFKNFADRNRMWYYQAFEMMIEHFIKTFKRKFK